MPKVNENKVADRRCPCCGRMRPEDWYEPKSAVCWKCRALGKRKPEKEVMIG